jgi:hypothetical protein
MLAPDGGIRKETNICSTYLKITVTEGLVLLLPIQYRVFVLGNRTSLRGLSQVDTRCYMLKYG